MEPLRSCVVYATPNESKTRVITMLKEEYPDTISLNKPIRRQSPKVYVAECNGDTPNRDYY